MTVSTFSILVFNTNTVEHPVYKAIDINGFGQGFGKEIETAVEDCCRQVRGLVDVCNATNIPLDLITKESWMACNESFRYGYYGWDDSDVIWKDIPYSQMMANPEEIIEQA